MFIRKSGFSLIELLVVIAVIAILASILMPVFLSAKRSALKTVCASNLSHISKAMEMYTSDYNGFYPNTNDPYLWMGRRWRWPIWNYLETGAKYNPNDPNGPNQLTGKKNSVLACPSDPTPGNKWDKTSYGFSASFYHLPDQIDSMVTQQLYNGSFPSPPCVSMNVNTVSFPSQKVMVADWLGSHTASASGWWSWDGSRNYLFADGHIKYLDANRILKAISPIAGVNRTAYPDINLTTNGIMGKDID